jgi:hypothetical protein
MSAFFVFDYLKPTLTSLWNRSNCQLPAHFESWLLSCCDARIYSTSQRMFANIQYAHDIRKLDADPIYVYHFLTFELCCIRAREKHFPTIGVYNSVGCVDQAAWSSQKNSQCSQKISDVQLCWTSSYLKDFVRLAQKNIYTQLYNPALEFLVNIWSFFCKLT